MRRWPRSVSQSIPWWGMRGRQPRSTCILQRATLTPAASLGALPAQGVPKQRGACHTARNADGWAGCRLRGAGSRPDESHGEQLGSFLTATEMEKPWLPARLRHPTPVPGDTLCLGRPARAHAPSCSGFGYTLTGTRTRRCFRASLPKPHLPTSSLMCASSIDSSFSFTRALSF